ncbi:MAG TPA: flagellar basal body-associated protein FliL [Oxalicibacterium sp.]|jgi:flagellar FliL protein|nr:flagellar basal body-associated protein FliL [Oxalicibacterium sp.]
MATKAAPKASSPEPAEEKPKSRLWIIVIALALILAGGGAGAWYFLNQKAAADDQPKAHAEEVPPPVFLSLDAFTVNLQPGDSGEQFLQTSLTFQVADQAQVELLKLYMPNVRSRLLLLLSSKKPGDILTVDGKHKLSQEILDIFKQPLVPGGPKAAVTSVLFTSFVVQ